MTERLAAILLHPRLREGDTEQRFVGQVALWLVAGGFVGATLVCVYFVASGDVRLLWAQAGYMAAVLCAPIFTRRIGTVRAVQLYVLTLAWGLVTAVIAESGGATSSALYFYALVPFFGGPSAAAASRAWARSSSTSRPRSSTGSTPSA